VSAENRVVASSATGSIYDLGYRHYAGKRHGSAYAMWSLYVESVRGVWGFGRPMGAKAAPFILLGLYSLGALFQLAFSSQIASQIASGQNPGLFTYANYFEGLSFFIMLFLVAQAPELVCRDQRYHVLSLYFTRSLGRLEYAISRYAALVTSVFLALLLPVVLLFVGDVLMKTDTLSAVGTEWPKALPAIPASLLIAFGASAIALTISSYSPRRAYAAISFLAYYLLMEGVLTGIYAVGQQADWGWSDKLLLATPTTSLAAAGSWFYGSKLPPGLPLTVDAFTYVLACLASIVLFSAILMFRYRRLSA
jgi:ABC-2 type transport system permease protein